jgi:hypothetical protein
MRVLTNLKDAVATDSLIGRLNRRQLLHEITRNISWLCAERASAMETRFPQDVDQVISNQYNISNLLLYLNRLTPTLWLVMLSYIFLFRNFYNGPSYPHKGLGSIEESCLPNLWANFLYINNYIGGVS